MKKRIALLLTAIAVFAVSLQAQSFNMLLLQQKLALQESELTNGYDTPIKSEDWSYENYWNSKTDAMLTRATNGTMEISWLSDPIKHIGKSGAELLMLVCTTPSSNPKNFELWVGDNSCVVLQNIKQQQWVVSSPDGISCEYIEYGNNPSGDGMAFMVVTLPESMVKIGERVKFKLVGQKQESNAFFMIFKNRKLIEELVSRSENDELFRVEKGQKSITIEALPKWIGKEVVCIVDGVNVKGKFVKNGALASLNVATGETDAKTLKLKHGDRSVFEVDNMQNIEAKDNLNGAILTQLLPSKEHENVFFVSQVISSAINSYRSLASSYAANSDVYIMVSSHQDIAWMDSPYNCVEDRDKLIVTPALELLAKYPDFRYDIEDALILEEYLERHPDKRGIIGEYIAQGRLGIGASYTQPYEEIQSAEALVRQFYFGKRWVEKSFPGHSQRSYWNVDVPGRAAQMPQILKKCGVDYLMYSRHETGIYRWFSPDGSSVLTFTPGHYTKASGFLRKNIDLGIDRFVSYTENFPNYRTDKSKVAVIGMLSAEDMSEAHTYHNWIDAMKERSEMFNLTLPRLHHSTSDMFMDAMSKSADQFHNIHGERPNLWQYIHSATHAKAFDTYGKATKIATQAETFNTIASLLEGSFKEYPKEELDQIWKAIIYPDHGWGGNKGYITDSLFLAKYQFALKQGDKITNRALKSIASRVKTNSKKGIPIIVFNPLSFNRQDRVFVELDKPLIGNYIVTDSKGRRVNASIDNNRIEFSAHVPSVGYATYYLKEDKPSKNQVESKYYSLEFDNGVLRQIVDKTSGEALFDCSKFAIADVICLQSVGNGAGEFSTMQRPSMEHFEQASAINNIWEKCEENDLFYLYSSQAKFRDATIIRYMKAYKGIKRIDFYVDMIGFNGTKYLEYRTMFPLRSKMEVTYATPFSTTTVGKDEMKGSPGERYQDEAKDIHPRTVSGWIAASDGDNNITLNTSAALVDYIDPTNNAVDNTILQPIILASRRSCHPLGEFYHQNGDHHFEFSITSNSGDWRGSLKQGLSSDNDMKAVLNPKKWIDANLPEARSFFAVNQQNVVISTIKKAEDSNSVVVRFYDAVGKEVDVTIYTPFTFTRKMQTDMLENNDRHIWSEVIKLGTRSIETIKLSR